MSDTRHVTLRDYLCVLPKGRTTTAEQIPADGAATMLCWYAHHGES